jgi:VanZ family protein
VLRRHKYILLCLGLYWPVLFVSTHIPIPDIARQSGMSDKTMHVLAYMVLVFFVWLAISPYRKVDWRKAKAWLVIVGVVGYGAFDEWLQGRMGRTMNAWDLAADFGGVIGGLAILSIFEFWPASLAICSITIFCFANLSKIGQKINLTDLNIAIHFIGYAVFTLIWIQYIYRVAGRRKLRRISWAGWMIFPGVVLLGMVKGYGILIQDMRLVWIENLTALTAILSAVVVSGLVMHRGRGHLPLKQRADTGGRRSKASATN